MRGPAWRAGRRAQGGTDRDPGSTRQGACSACWPAGHDGGAWRARQLHAAGPRPAPAWRPAPRTRCPRTRQASDLAGKFAQYDLNDDGRLDAGEVRSMAGQLGIELSDAEASAAIQVRPRATQPPCMCCACRMRCMLHHMRMHAIQIAAAGHVHGVQAHALWCAGRPSCFRVGAHCVRLDAATSRRSLTLHPTPQAMDRNSDGLVEFAEWAGWWSGRRKK